MRLAHVSDLLPTLAPSSSSSSSSALLRATTENHALDSYQNLLFSVARFHEYTGRWPARITVVGYEMKRRRFTELHRAALRWPAPRFAYVGIDAESEDAASAQQGEVCRLKSSLLVRKRALADTAGVAAAERVLAVHAGHVRVPWDAPCEAARAQPVPALPLVLLVRARARWPVQLVSGSLPGRARGALSWVSSMGQLEVDCCIENEPLSPDLHLADRFL